MPSVASGSCGWPDAVAGGTPRLETDRAEIDFGDLRFARWVVAMFTFRNGSESAQEKTP
jgi:hypothetical protein